VLVSEISYDCGQSYKTTYEIANVILCEAQSVDGNEWFNLTITVEKEAKYALIDAKGNYFAMVCAFANSSRAVLITSPKEEVTPGASYTVRYIRELIRSEV
jgi:hypothetical protein